MVPERRQFARLTPRSPLFVHLDESKRGLVLDVCQGGLAVASLVPKSQDEVISLAFDLPEANVQLELRPQTRAQLRPNHHAPLPQQMLLSARIHNYKKTRQRHNRDTR
jgi:hypothetical protein